MGNTDNEDNKKCHKFKDDLEDALKQLDALKGSKIQPNVREKLDQMLREAYNFAKEKGYQFDDSSTLPKQS